MKLSKLPGSAPAGLALTRHLHADAAADGQSAALWQKVRNKPQGARSEQPGAQWFSEAGLGLFIHWDIASVKAVGDPRRKRSYMETHGFDDAPMFLTKLVLFRAWG